MVTLAAFGLAALGCRGGSEAGPEPAPRPTGPPTTSTQATPAPTVPTPVTPAPAGAVPVSPDEVLAEVVSRHPAGATFLLRAGVHRLASVEPRDNDAFVGEEGAVLSGARVVTGFRRSNAIWVADGLVERSQPHGECATKSSRCSYNEDVYLDGELLTAVSARTAVRKGAKTAFIDYTAKRLYLGIDPTGRVVEVASAPFAFAGDARGVSVRGLAVERYATPAQAGAIEVGENGGEWRIEDCVVRQNHGGGVVLRNGSSLRRCQVLDNGQIGVKAQGAGNVVEGNEIARNNTAGFDAGWEAGGTKFARTVDLVVRGNDVHSNVGTGLWTDIDNVRTLYEDNHVHDNAGMGIFHEISYDAVIRNNRIERNGADNAGWVWGAGIQIASSAGVEVIGNELRGNHNGIVGTEQRRGQGELGPWTLRDLVVRDNVIVDSGTSGVAQDIGDRGVYSRGIAFSANRYEGRVSFTWLDQKLDWSGWIKHGLDAEGRFLLAPSTTPTTR
ncbi:MAG: right-handed parallel beta-helix repeat-containing protein [Acidimicrobiales bacterium]